MYAVRYRTLASMLALLIALTAASSLAAAKTETAVTARAAFAKRSLAFERVGDGHFLARGHGYALELADGVAAISLQERARHAVVKMTFDGASSRPEMREERELEGRVNYIHGTDPSRWRLSIPTYEQVRCTRVYPGIDAVFYGNQSRLEYDLVVQPGADAGVIGVRFSGAKSTRIDRKGNLVVDTGAGTLRFDRPVAYQEISGERRPVDVSYHRSGRHTVGFKVGAYDRSTELVIDPVLVYSTFFGGVGEDYVYDLTLDSFGNAYIAGGSDGSAFLATPGAYDTSTNGGPAIGTDFYSSERTREAFVSKISGNGNTVLWTTFLGGSSIDTAFGIEVDSSGVVVVGETRSRDFPTTSGAAMESLPDGFGDFATSNSHAFVTKLNSSGSAPIFSTYLGGNSNYESDRACAVALDSGGNIYVTGETTSADFPVTAGVYQPAINSTTILSRQDAFVTKFNSSGAIAYSTFVGGQDTDRGDSIGVDSAGNAIIRVRSQAFPTTSANRVSAFGDYFVVKLDSTASDVLWSTGVGSNTTPGRRVDADNEGRGLVVDAAGAVYVTGYAGAGIATTPSAFQPAYPGCRSAFVQKINPGGTLAYGTYLNGPSATCRDSIGHAIAVDSSGRAFVTGYTENPEFPVANPFQPTHARTSVGYAGSDDVFITALNADGASLFFSTFLGGSGNDWGIGVAVDSSGVTATGVLQGWSGMRSLDFWQKNPVQPVPGITYNTGDIFVAKLNLSAATPAFGIESVLPAFFSANDSLLSGTVRGFGFQDGATITVDGKPTYTPATFLNSSFLSFTPPSNMPPGTFTLTVTNPGGAKVSAPITFALSPRLEYTSFDTKPFTPMEGPSTGGTVVTIKGYNYDRNAKVAFGDIPAASVTWVSENQILATSPPHQPECVEITITNPNGQFAGDADRCDFRFIAPVPTVDAVTPSSVYYGGQQIVSVTGSNFFGSNVSFGSESCTNQTVLDPHTMTALQPLLNPGTFDLQVRNADSTTSVILPKAVTILGTPSIDPIFGPRAGGTVVTLRGNAFQEGAEVFFGQSRAASVTFVDATTLRATTPPNSGGTVRIWVRNPNGLFMIFQDFAFVTLNDAMSLAGVSPATGPTVGGTQLTITGAGFVAPPFLHAWVGGIPATNVTKVDETTIQVTTPAHDEGVVDVVVMNQDSNASTAVLEGSYTYILPAPTITSITPAGGLPEGGTSVTIHGANFSAGAMVKIGGLDLVNPVFVNSATITGTTPPHVAGTVDVVVTNPGPNASTLTGAFTYGYPLITLSPATSDVYAGATASLTLTASYAQTTATTVGLASSSAAATVDANITIPAYATTTTVNVTGVSEGTATITASLPPALGSAQATALVNVSARPPAPTLTAVTPSSGPKVGGTVITITGTNFLAGTTVTIGSVAATNVTFNSATQITATTPAQAAGTYGVTVTLPDAQYATLGSAFTYIEAPSVSSVSPSTGPLAGGTAVTVTGAYFANGAQVKFGATSATGISVTSSTQINCTTPAGTGGYVDVTVTNTDGQSDSKTNAFRYIGPAPTVASLSPTSGPQSGGTVITISGTDFVAGATVMFGSAAATNVTVTSTQITCTTPAGTPGSVDVIVTNPDGQSATKPGAFTYGGSVPTITSFTPTGAPPGDTVVITGTNFVDVTAVSFGGTPATNYTVDSATQITAIIPNGAMTGSISVTTPAGTATSTPMNIWPGPPVIDAVTPARGSRDGGTVVTITGWSFRPGLTVMFGSTPATIELQYGTSITVVAPAHAEGVVDITVKNFDWTTVTKSSAYTYTRPVDPNGDGKVNASDIVYLINYLFAGGPTPAGNGDANGDSATNVVDVFFLVNQLFTSGN